MSLWKKIENEYFWISYSFKHKSFILKMNWNEKVYTLNINFSLDKTNLSKD